MRSQLSACQKSLFDKLVDGEASSPATATLTSFRLKSYGFPAAKLARKRFLLWKMGFPGAKIAPRPPYTPLGSIESSRGLRPSRALRGFFDSLTAGNDLMRSQLFFYE